MRILVVALVALGSVACVPADAPIAVMKDGKIAEIQNCPPLKDEYKRECLLLTCESTLFNRATIPAHARIVASRSEINFSDNASLSRHFVKFPEADKFRYAMCEMSGAKIVFVRELSARDQDW